MTLTRTYHSTVGVLVLLTVSLSIWVSPVFFWGTAFIGLNLFQSGLTNWCPLLVGMRAVGLHD